MFQGLQQNNQLFFSYICIRVCVGRKVLFKMKKAGTKKKIKIRRWIIGILLGVGFLAMEFPGILLVRERIYPFVPVRIYTLLLGIYVQRAVLCLPDILGETVLF